MSTILGLFFFIIIIVLIFGLSIISGILRLLFGFGRRRSGGNKRQKEQQNSSHSNEGSDTLKSDVQQNRKKIFDKNEGEYVDFEEVKDEKK